MLAVFLYKYSNSLGDFFFYDASRNNCYTVKVLDIRSIHIVKKKS